MAPHIVPESKPLQPGLVQHTYDYDTKYERDSPGEELKPNARVWKVYMDEAEVHDHDMIKGFRETLDVLLVLAALFSGVIITCVVQTSLELDPDYAEIAVHLMTEQIQLMRSPGNTTAVPSSPLGPESVTHTQLDVWINGLFYASLSFSLAAALLSALAKQWLTSYCSNVSGDAENRSLHRQFRFNGFQKWKIKDVIGFLPVILHLSLAIFLVGFALFVYRRHPLLSTIVFIIAGFTFLFYTVTAILTAIWQDCPYRNPVLSRPAQITIYLATMVPYFFLQMGYQARFFPYFLSHIKYKVLSVYHDLRVTLDCKLHRPSTASDKFYEQHLLFPPHRPQLLHFRPQSPQRLVDRLEHDVVDNTEFRTVLVADALLWLIGETTNASIKTIVIHTAASDVSHFLSTETSLVPHTMSLFLLVSLACDRLFSFPPPEDEHTLSGFLCAIIKRFKYVAPWTTPLHRVIPVNIIERAIEHGRTDIVLALCGSKNSAIDSPCPGSGSGSGRMLSLAVLYGHEGLTTLLLEKGANPNAHPHDWTDIPPLWQAISNGYFNIATRLLAKGADPHVRHLECHPHWQSVMPPIHWACINGDLPLLNLLFSHNANPYVTDTEGRSPLHAACTLRQVEVVKVLLSLHEPFEIRSFEGDQRESRTPLHFLCGRPVNFGLGCDDDFDSIADLLLSHDIDMLDARNNLDGWTPLHSASRAGDIHAVKYLVDHGANTTLLTHSGEHLLHLTCEYDFDSLELIKFLCIGLDDADRPDIDIRDTNGRTPLFKICDRYLYSSDSERIEMDRVVEFLLSRGADIHAADKDGRSPLTISRPLDTHALTDLLLDKSLRLQETKE